MDDGSDLYNNRDTKLDRVIHAELNAIFNSGGSVEGCTLFVAPFLPCHRCAVHVIQAGIKEVVSFKYPPDRWQHSISMSEEFFNEANVKVLTYAR
jgi:dCMP deaminase